jgi:uncharacterized protein (DUF433 family)
MDGSEIQEKHPSLAELVNRDPEIMSGALVFRGTRVTVETLFENLADGMTVDEILDDFPTLDRDDVLAVLSLTSAAIAAAKAA